MITFLINRKEKIQQERTKVHTRQVEGAVAKANGKHLARPQMNLNALTEKQKQTLEELWP